MRPLAFAAAACLAACLPPLGGGDGGADGGADSGTPLVGCIAGPAGPGDSGVDADALLGPACDPALLNAYVSTCRIEPLDRFFNVRCRPLTAADNQRFRELLQQSGTYSCAAFGAGLMACMGARAGECQVDGGASAMAAVGQRLYEDCADGGQPRFDAGCADACDARHTACFGSCAGCAFESCAACSFACGKLYVACMRACPPP